jgi:hypothetical protein
MKHIFNYHEYKFTTDSRRKLSGANIEFWQRLDAIEKHYDVNLVVIHNLKQDFGATYEDLKFECVNPDILPEVEAILRECYHNLPLKPFGGA